MIQRSRENSRWWGWGELSETFDLTSRPFFWPYLQQFFRLPQEPILLPPEVERFAVPPSRLTTADIQALQQIISANSVLRDNASRVQYAVGKSYRDLIRLRYYQIDHYPDAVVLPANEHEVAAIMQWAVARKIALVPRGGGTSVVGGVEALRGHCRAVVVLVLRRLNRVLKIWRESLLVDVQAGILGPELEARLQAEGLTLGHFPESFHYSTVGGWVATRSAGQQSTGFGKIEDMVERVCVITPSGSFCTPGFPAAADGPEAHRLLVGSEGRLGVIVQVRLRVRPLPAKRYYTAFLMPDFISGAEVVRLMMQQELQPALVRLADPVETEFFFALRKKHAHLRGWLQEQLINRYLPLRGYKKNKRSLLLVGFEGSQVQVREQRRQLHRLLRSSPHLSLGTAVGRNWYHHRFRNPYLRDVLLDYGLFIDTLETATNWHHWQHLYQSVCQAIENAFAHLGIPGVVMAHISHVYRSGTSLYFILLAQPPEGEALNTWDYVKRIASRAIVENFGTISHHHGVGVDHRPWIRRELDVHLLQMLKAMCQKVDPTGILNPGKLLPEDDA